MPSVSIPAAIASIGSAIGIGSSAAAAGVGLAGTAAGIGSGIGAAAATVGATAPGWLGIAGTASSLLGGVTGAVGAYEQGEAASRSAKFNAQVERQNAAISQQNAAIAGQAGSEQAWMTGQKTRSNVGSIKANQAASGIDVNSGSAVDVRSSASELGELDALTVRSNAAREAYGYQQQAASHTEQSNLDTFESKADSTAGAVNAAGTFLGGVGSASDNFLRYQLSGGFGG